MKTLPATLSSTGISCMEPGGFVSLVASSRSLKWRGVQVDHFRAERFDVDYATAPFHLISLLLSDDYSYESKVNGALKKRIFHRDRIWVHPAGVPLFNRARSRKDCVLLALDPVTAHACAGEEWMGLPLHFDSRYNVDDPRLKALLLALLAEAEAGGPNGAFFVESLTTALSIHFLKNYSDVRAFAEHEPGLDRRAFLRAVDYMEAHLAEDVSLDDVARETAMSKYHFSRLFKKTTGMTPHQYLLKRRAERARQLLELKRYTISEVAFLTGFSDQSHLNRVFKRFHGTTPGAVTRR